jgi:LacI family transcriptional regulator
MTRRPTLGDVAALAGVHVATASRALNPSTASVVNAATADRIARAAAELGYEVNAVARGLRTARSATVGVILPDITNALFPPMVRGVEDALRDHGFGALMANTDNDPLRAQRAVESLRARQVDGFILATAQRRDPLIAALTRATIPVVLMNRMTDDTSMATVVGQDTDGVRQVMEHLVTLGHSRIAHLAGPVSLSTGAERAAAFRRQVQRLRLQPTECKVVRCATYTIEAGQIAARRVLADRDWCPARPTAIAAANDLIAIGALAEASRQGLACPDDLSIVGFNDMPLAGLLSPGLTTVRTPNYHVGHATGQMLVNLINGHRVEQNQLRLPTDLIVRGSTAAPAGRVSVPTTESTAAL